MSTLYQAGEHRPPSVDCAAETPHPDSLLWTVSVANEASETYKGVTTPVEAASVGRYQPYVEHLHRGIEIGASFGHGSQPRRAEEGRHTLEGR